MAQNQGGGGKDSIRKKSLLLSVSILILIIAFLSITTVMILRPLESSARNNMAETRDRLIQQIEELTGRRLEYGSMSPSIFGSLDIRNIRLLRDDNSPVLSISRLRVSFSLLNLLRGNFDDGFRSIQLDHPVLTMDFPRDNDLIQLFFSEDFSQNNLPEALWPENFQFRIRNGEWSLVHRGPLNLIISNFNLDGTVRNDRIAFNSRWNAAGTLVPGNLVLGTNDGGSGPGLANILSSSMTGRTSGEFSLSSGEGSAQISIPTLYSDLYRFQPMEFNFFLKDRKLEIRKVYNRSPVDLMLVWDTRTNNINASLFMENFTPQVLITLTGSWRRYNPWMATRLSGQALLEINEEGIDYSLDFIGFTDGDMVFNLAAAGNEEKIEIQNFYADSDYGSISYAGEFGLNPLAPSGLLTVSNLIFLDERSLILNGLNGEFIISSQGREISILGEHINSGGVNLSGLEINIFQAANGMTFYASVIQTDENTLASFILEGSLIYQSQRMEAVLNIGSFSTQDIIDLSSPFTTVLSIPGLPRNIMENILITTEVFLSTNFRELSYRTPGISISYQGQDDLSAFISLSGTNQRFDLDQGHIYWAGGRAGLLGFIDFANPNNISFSLQASYKDLFYQATGSILDGNYLNLQGSYGLEVYFSPAAIYGYSGYARAQQIPIPIGENYANLSFLLSIRYDSASSWSADINNIELVNIPAFSSDTTLRLSGSATQNGVWVPDIRYDDGLGLLSGNLSIHWDPDYQDFRFFAGINDAGDRERYRFFGTFDRNNTLLEIALNTEAMRLARTGANIHNGFATGNFRILMDSWQSFNAEVDLSSITFQLMNQVFTSSAQAYLDNDEFILQELKINYGRGLGVSMPNFRLNRLEGWAYTEANAWVSGGEHTMDLSFQGSAYFVPINTWRHIDRILDSIQGSLNFAAPQYLDFETEESFHLVFSSTRDDNGPSIFLEGGPRNMIRLRFTPENGGMGNFYAALSAPSAIRGSFTGTIDSRNIEINIPDLYVDMGSLWRFIPPQDIIAFPGGIVSGSLQISGPLRDPGFYGTARATSLRVRVPMFISDEIRPIPVQIRLDGNEMSFGPVSATVGNGSGVVNGTFQFVQWIPNVFSMDFLVPHESPIPVGFDISGVVARGRVSGAMNLSMENLNLDVSGDLTAHNTQITLNSLGFGFSIDYGYDIVTVTTNLTIRTGRQVEFFWPSVEWPIIQAGADLGTGIRITSDSGSERFTVLGDVLLRSGEIFYLDRNFYLRQGALYFNENETRFDPRISARAEIRDHSSEGPVIISMIIDNAPLQSFSPRFESNPPLTQFEILSLLGHYQSGNLAESERDTNALIALTADALTQFTVMRTLQREIRDYLGLDMFSFRTQAIQNMVFQGIGLQSTLDQDQRVGNYFDNTTIFLGKYLGSDVFFESLFSLRYDPAKQTWGGMNLEPEVGLEFRNPLFDIRMNVLLQHPENWFINDISFSLTRKWFF